MKNLKPKKSILKIISDIKATILKSDEPIRNHVIFGVEVDDNGKPSNIFCSTQTNGFTGLGMIEAIQMMLDRERQNASEGFIDILDKNDIFAKKSDDETDIAGIPKEIVEKIPPDVLKDAMTSSINDIQGQLINTGGIHDEEIAKVLEEFKDDLGNALMAKDPVKLKEVEDKIQARLREIKGSDFKANFAFGMDDPTTGGFPPGPDNLENRDEFPGQEFPNSGFDPKKVRKYF